MAPEKGLGCVPVPSEGSSVGRRNRCSLCRSTNLQCDHMLARRMHRLHSTGEGCRIAQRLNEESHHLGVSVPGEVLKIVRNIEPRCVADRDQIRNAEPSECRKCNAGRAAVRNNRDAPLSHAFRNARTVERHTFANIDKAQAIRAAQPQIKAGAEGVELALPLSTLLAELSKPARKNDGGPQSPRGPFL